MVVKSLPASRLWVKSESSMLISRTGSTGSKQADEQQAVFDVATSHTVQVPVASPRRLAHPSNFCFPRGLPISDGSGVPFRS